MQGGVDSHVGGREKDAVSGEEVAEVRLHEEDLSAKGGEGLRSEGADRLRGDAQRRLNQGEEVSGELKRPSLGGRGDEEASKSTNVGEIRRRISEKGDGGRAGALHGSDGGRVHRRGG